MKNKKKKVWKWAPLFVFILSLWLPVKTEAAEKSCTLTIPVQVEVSGENIPGGKDYKVTLEAVTKNAPLPIETVKTRTGAGTITFGPVTYGEVGTYQYRISQDTDSAERFNYDRTAYLVDIQVIRRGDGTLTAEVVAKREGKQEKSDAIRFDNRYDAPKNQSSGGSGGHRSAVRAVRTGDTQHPLMWLLTAGATAMAIALIIRKSIAKKREKKERIYRQRMSVYR